MRNKLLLIAAVVGVLIAAILLAAMLPDPVAKTRPRHGIISMSPSITEMLFALELGDRVVGVTAFCNYPPEARKIARVGGYNDPNLEAIVALNPEWIVMLDEHRSAAPALDDLDCRKLFLADDSIEEILEAIRTLGRTFDARAKAEQLVADLRARIRRIEEKTGGQKRPRVMVVIDRTPGAISGTYVAGSDRLTNQIVRLAGGENVFEDTDVRFPIVSLEGILGANPEVILDLSVTRSGSPEKAEEAVADWQRLPGEVEAVRHGRVHAVADDYATIPGPRFILLVEKLAQLFHPEVDWGRAG